MGIALIHSIFNVFTTVVLFPFIRGLEKLAYLTIPESDEEKSAKEDVFAILDERFVSSPAFAIEQCKTLVNQMAEITKTVLSRQWNVSKNLRIRNLRK